VRSTVSYKRLYCSIQHQQYSAVLFNTTPTVQCCTVQYNTNSTVLYCSIQHTNSTVLYCSIQHQQYSADCVSSELGHKLVRVSYSEP